MGGRGSRREGPEFSEMNRRRRSVEKETTREVWFKNGWTYERTTTEKEKKAQGRNGFVGKVSKWSRSSRLHTLV